MCTLIKGVDLNLDDFAKFYDIINFNITLLEHVITKFPYLLHFFDSWVVYKETKGILLVRPYRTPPSC
jgi:hypothetical protein